MAEYSLPQAGNSNINPAYVDAGPYLSDEWARLFRVLFTGDAQASQGVLKGVWNELAVTHPAALNLSIATGVGICNGHVYFNDTSAVSITVTGGVNRSDALCMVENNTNAALPVGPATNYNTVGDVNIPPYSARLAVVKNIGANFVQTTALYMVQLATFTTGAANITNLTDARNYCEFATDIPDDSVDDTKVGDRVPQFYRRQGGSASAWATPGSTTYTPAAVRMQAGAIALTAITNPVTVTFPVAFSNTPLPFVSVLDNGFPDVILNTTAVSATQMTISAQTDINMDTICVWLAIGPE